MIAIVNLDWNIFYLFTDKMYKELGIADEQLAATESMEIGMYFMWF